MIRLSRISLHVEVTPVSIDEISNTALPTESSKDIAERVLRARELQAEHFKGLRKPETLCQQNLLSHGVTEL